MDEQAGRDKSGSVERRRLTVPRWLLRAWLWISLPVGLAGYYGFPSLDVDSLWFQIRGDSSILFALVPVTLALFFPQETPAIVVVLAFGLMTLIIDRVLVIRVPKAMPLLPFAGGMVLWFLLAQSPFLIWIVLNISP